jgi:hypothetical protein
MQFDLPLTGRDGCGVGFVFQSLFPSKCGVHCHINLVLATTGGLVTVVKKRVNLAKAGILPGLVKPIEAQLLSALLALRDPLPHSPRLNRNKNHQEMLQSTETRRELFYQRSPKARSNTAPMQQTHNHRQSTYLNLPIA